eukprot:TRINITY_DN3369_c0_g3_i1.p1 TRINITY_DN3369_c0_g3~~TRINITY_DN3369_c0_g3_i1.p1  ORF type:complete len:425 (+),score=96.02 TRINITY_DN3369_c0_g3_i1:79-1353(+)
MVASRAGAPQRRPLAALLCPVAAAAATAQQAEHPDRVVLASGRKVYSGIVVALSPPGDAGGANCPPSCGEAIELCQTLYGAGGELTAANCSAATPHVPLPDGATPVVQSFRCSCNGGASGPTFRQAEEGGLCTRTGGDQTAFPQDPPVSPSGEWCLPSTGTCPSPSCDAEDQHRFCLQLGALPDTVECGAGQLRCSLCSVAGVLTYYLNTTPEEGGGCSSWEPAAVECSAGETCNGHGCCSSTGEPTCICFRDAVLGHWAGPTCSECARDWTGAKCIDRSWSITGLLGGTPSAAPAVAPFFSLGLVFCLIVGCRKRWSYELPPRLDDTVMRALQIDPKDHVSWNHHVGFFAALLGGKKEGAERTEPRKVPAEPRTSLARRAESAQAPQQELPDRPFHIPKRHWRSNGVWQQRHRARAVQQESMS